MPEKTLEQLRRQLGDLETLQKNVRETAQELFEPKESVADEAPVEKIAWAKEKLLETAKQIAEVKGQIDTMTAQAEHERIFAQIKQDTEDLLAYERVKADGNASQLSPALLKRYTAAEARANERKLMATSPS